MISLAKQIERKQKRLEDVRQRLEKDQARVKELEAEIASLSRSRNDTWSKNLFQALKKEGQKVDFSDLSMSEAMEALKIALTKKMETEDAEGKSADASKPATPTKEKSDADAEKPEKAGTETDTSTEPEKKEMGKKDSPAPETKQSEEKPNELSPFGSVSAEKNDQPKNPQKEKQEDSSTLPDPDKIWQSPDVF